MPKPVYKLKTPEKKSLSHSLSAAAAALSLASSVACITIEKKIKSSIKHTTQLNPVRRKHARVREREEEREKVRIV
jgi:hypothetical protein